MWVVDSFNLSQMLGVDTGHDASPLTPIAAHRFHRLHDPQVSPSMAIKATPLMVWDILSRGIHGRVLRWSRRSTARCGCW
jgi:hypothetical protein